MKKRILSIILAAALTVGTLLAAFPTAFAADEGEKVWASWRVADNILGAIEKANGDVAALEFDAIKWQNNYYGSSGVKSVSYAVDTYSKIVGSGTNSEWQCQLLIRNHRGYGVDNKGVDYQMDGVIVFCAANNYAQKLTFTAPVHGKYNLVPLALGGGDKVDNSLLVSNGGWNVEVQVNGTTVEGSQVTLAKGEKGDLLALNNVELQEGETISVVFTAPSENWDSNAGNNISVNFKVDLVDEIAPQVLITEVRTESINVVKAMAATSTTGAVFTHPLIQYGYKGGASSVYTDITNFGIAKHTLVEDGYTRFYNEWSSENSNETSVYDAPEKNNLAFKTKNAGVIAIKITADAKGTFTLSASKVTPNQVEGFLKVVTPDGETVVTNNTDGFKVSANLDMGESMYLVASRNAQGNWNQMSISVKDLNLDVTYANVVYHEAVYNSTEYDVPTELKKNTGNWDTAYQPAEHFTYSGFLKGVATNYSATTYVPALLRINDKETDPWDCFVGATQTYDMGSFYVYESGKVKFADESEGAYRVGFSFTAEADAQYVFETGAFTGSGSIVGKVYQVVVEGEVTTLVEKTMSGSYSAGFNATIDAKEGETYCIVFGKGSSGWGNKPNVTTDHMTLTENVLVSPERWEELPLEYGDDPNYEFKYEYTEDNTNHADELAAAADYALADGVLTVTFPAAPEHNTVEYNWAVWVEQEGRWVKLDATDANTFSGAVESEDGVYKTYILCTDDAGLTLLKTYDNFIDDVTAESVGNAVISGVYVDGVAVERDAYADISDGSVELKVEGANIASLTYSIDGAEAVEMTDGAATLALTETGAYEVILTATSDKGEGATKKIVINTYKADDDKVYGDVTSVDVVVDGANVTVNATVNAGALEYQVISQENGFKFAPVTNENGTATFDMTGKYGKYYAAVRSKDENGKIEDSWIESFEIKRDAEWDFHSKVNGSYNRHVEVVRGTELNFEAWGSVEGFETSDIEYIYIKKDANGTTIINRWGTDATASFTPTAAGTYSVLVGARVKGAGSYEIFHNFTVVVEGDVAEGTVAVTVSGNTAKAPVTFTATCDADEALLYRFTVEKEGGKRVIQKYSPANTCTYIPVNAGTYTIKVEVISADSFGIYDVKGSTTFTVA